MNIAKWFLESGSAFNPARFVALYHSGSGHQQRQQATSDFNQQKALTNKAQGSLSQFEGPVQQSPFYKALYKQGVESTSNAYSNARANMNARANRAGFGYAQPITQGANDQMDAAEAKSMADVPTEAMLATAPLTMSAAGETAGMGMGYGSQGAGLLNANANNMSAFYRQLLQAGQQAGQAGAAAAAAG